MQVIKSIWNNLFNVMTSRKWAYTAVSLSINFSMFARNLLVDNTDIARMISASKIITKISLLFCRGVRAVYHNQG
jgi:hypothetical protein